MRPHLLISNDDGIDSVFLRKLVEAHRTDFDITVVAPKHEQSWTGRSMTRRRNLRVEPQKAYPVPAYSVDGTPTDCVNLALGHLLSEPPVAVLSGVNVGINCSLTLFLNSGTVAAASEGAIWGLPALAFSQQVPKPFFEAIAAGRQDEWPEVMQSIEISCQRAVEFTLARLAEPTDPTQARIDNINFPNPIQADSPVRRTRLWRRRGAPLHTCQPDGTYAFGYQKGESLQIDDDHDAAWLEKKHISHSVVCLGALAAD
ncbi:MAG: 5'/3'-nucleotidase SurE [Opitutales bacterium]